MNEYNVGDLVEVVRGPVSLKGPLINLGKISGLALNVAETLTPSLSYFRINGYTITLIEKAAPALPTEPGYYLDHEGEAWALRVGLYPESALPQSGHPYTRLEPVAVTAARIALSLENNGQSIAADNVRNWYGE